MSLQRLETAGLRLERAVDVSDAARAALAEWAKTRPTQTGLAKTEASSWTLILASL